MEVDPLEIQLGYQRGGLDRPWLMANFVETIDGATVVDGGAATINDADDKAMFQACRAAADCIVVGAGTVRAENYGPVKLSERGRAARRQAALSENPRLVIVTGSLGLEPDHRVFSDPEQPITLLTGENAPDDRFAALSEVADVVRLKSTDAPDILSYLDDAKVVLCEGGASLLGQFVAARLVDEMALTIAPVMVAGESNRVAQGGDGARPPLEMRLDRVLYGDRSVFLRYLRADGAVD